MHEAQKGCNIKKAKKNVWTEVSKKFNETNETGIYPRTADECRKKWNHLRFGVQKYRENSKRTSAGPVKEPDYLDEIENILGSAFIVGIPGVAEDDFSSWAPSKVKKKYMDPK